MSDSDQITRILCMEDNPGVARLFQRHLERAGYTVDLACDGHDGLAKLDASAYDVVIVDQQMPGMTGLDVIRSLVDADALPPTVMVTGAGDEETAVAAMKLGAEDYLVKDVDGGYLRLLPSVIERVLAKRRLVEERREAVDALRRSERLYRTVVENTSDVILLQDEAWRVVFINEAGLAYTGFDEGRMLGKPVAEFLPPDIRAAHLHRRERRLSGDWANFTYDSAFINAAGQRIEVTVRTSPIIVDGSYRGELLVARDMTEIQAMRARLEQRDRLAALGQLTSGVAHSFRNFLNTIMLHAEMDLRRPGLSSEVARSLRTILQESHRASDLVQQMLDFSSRAMIHREPVDLGSLVAAFVEKTSCRVPDDVHISLVQRLSAGDGPLVASVDGSRLRQALTNLADNARDAMPQGGELRFELSRVELGPDEAPPAAEMLPLFGGPATAVPPGGEWIRLVVADTGTGMTEALRSQVFSPFFTTKDVDQGTGLGLSQVYGIVRQHGGTVHLASTPGEGTTVTIHLPAHLEVESTASSTGPPRGHAADSKQTVLLAAADEAVRDAGERALSTLGYPVLTAHSMNEALAMCQAPRWAREGRRIGLVLLDLDLVETSPERVAVELRRYQPGVTILGLTERGTLHADRDELRDAGFAAILPTSSAYTEFARAAEEALGGSYWARGQPLPTGRNPRRAP